MPCYVRFSLVVPRYVLLYQATILKKEMIPIETDEIKTINLGKLLADFICSKEYGTIIHYQEIENVIGIKYREKRYQAQITKAQKILRQRGKAIKAIGKNGDYQLLYPGDYTAAYINEVRRARNRIKRGGQYLEGAPVSDMTADELSEYSSVNDFHKRLEASFQGSYVEVKRLSGRKHPLANAL